MNVLSLFGAFGTLLAAGYGVLSLLVGRSVRLSRAERIGFSWLFGAGAVSLLLWIFGFVANGFILQALVSLVCLLLGLVGWKKMPVRLSVAGVGDPVHPSFATQARLPANPQISNEPAWIVIVLAAVVAIEIAIVFCLSFVHTLGWDGLLNWEIKARYAFANGGVLPASYFSDAGRAFSHPEYPLAIPFTELWLYLWVGESNQFLAKTIFPTFYLAGTFLLAGFATRLTGKTWLGLVTAALLFFVPQMTVEVGCASGGYCDFPLSVFYLASAGCLFCAAEQGNEGFFRLYAACLALLPWVKRDGLILWAVAAACGLFVLLRTKKSAAFLVVFLPGLIIICGWHFYLGAMHSLQAADFLPFNLQTLRSHLDRAQPLLAALLAEFANLTTWSLFWFIVGVAVLYCIPRTRSPGVLALIIALIAPIILYLLLYLFSSWQNYLEHVGLSISRLLMQVAPVGFLLIALAASWRPQKHRQAVQIHNDATCAIAESERTAVVEFV
jgi:hypothetical protein